MIVEVPTSQPVTSDSTAAISIAAVTMRIRP